MYFLRVALVFFCSFSCTAAYLFPLCLKITHEDNCNTIFNLPTLNGLVYESEEEIPSAPAAESKEIDEAGSITDGVLSSLQAVFLPVSDYYKSHIEPLVLQVKYFPKLEEEAAKAEKKTSRDMYLLSVFGALAIYLILYFYVTRKIVLYYMKIVRKKFSRNFETFLKVIKE